MRVVTRRTGLSADLLRAWERRYEVVAPVRSESGQRLYSDADIERLQLLYRATLAGRSIGQVAALPNGELARLVQRDAEADRPTAGPLTSAAGAARSATAPAADYLGECLDAVARFDTTALEAMLRRAVVALPADSFLDELLVPLLDRLIGSGAPPAGLRPLHAQLALPVVRRVLDRVIETASSPLATPGLVVAAPAGVRHEFGALLAAAAAAAEGWQVIYLGADVPAEDIADAAAQTGARAVAVSIAAPADASTASHEIRRLAALLPDDVRLVDGSGASRSDDLSALRTALRAIDR